MGPVITYKIVKVNILKYITINSLLPRQSVDHNIIEQQ